MYLVLFSAAVQLVSVVSESWADRFLYIWIDKVAVNVSCFLGVFWSLLCFNMQLLLYHIKFMQWSLPSLFFCEDSQFLFQQDKLVHPIVHFLWIWIGYSLHRCWIKWWDSPSFCWYVTTFLKFFNVTVSFPHMHGWKVVMFSVGSWIQMDWPHFK